jgi:O-acetyl-ADP-ribose deacetylase (regulator of RNase III)
MLSPAWVVHTVGPVWSDDEDRSSLLADCHRNSLQVAAELGAKTIAFPAISTGIYRWPLRSAAEIALTTVREALTAESTITLVRFVLYDQDAHAVFATVAAKPA